jgi:hypothetical protein
VAWYFDADHVLVQRCKGKNISIDDLIQLGIQVKISQHRIREVIDQTQTALID